MPRYDWIADHGDCAEGVTAILTFKQYDASLGPQCSHGDLMRRKYARPGVQFKGAGWTGAAKVDRP